MKNLSMPLALDEQALMLLQALALPLEQPLRETFISSVMDELAHYRSKSVRGWSHALHPWGFW
jgi:hypothetical protein